MNLFTYTLHTTHYIIRVFDGLVSIPKAIYHHHPPHRLKPPRPTINPRQYLYIIYIYRYPPRRFSRSFRPLSSSAHIYRVIHLAWSPRISSTTQLLFNNCFLGYYYTYTYLKTISLNYWYFFLLLKDELHLIKFMYLLKLNPK